MPADQAVPSPESTSTPTSSRNSSASRTRSIWRLSAGLMQLRFSGRLKRTHAIWSTTSAATVSASARLGEGVSVMAIPVAARLDGEVPGLRLDGDPPQLGELVDAGLAAEAAVARRAHTA